MTCIRTLIIAAVAAFLVAGCGESPTGSLDTAVEFDADLARHYATIEALDAEDLLLDIRHVLNSEAAYHGYFWTSIDSLWRRSETRLVGSRLESTRTTVRYLDEWGAVTDAEAAVMIMVRRTIDVTDRWTVNGDPRRVTETVNADVTIVDPDGDEPQTTAVGSRFIELRVGETVATPNLTFLSSWSDAGDLAWEEERCLAGGFEITTGDYAAVFECLGGGATLHLYDTDGTLLDSVTSIAAPCLPEHPDEPWR